jgi:N-acetylneuraminic acid mutarotase
MQKSTSRSAFFRPRASIAFLGATFLILTGTLLAFFQPEAPAQASNRTMTFAERVSYQRAIEEVYWRHRIWPKERPDPKPSLDVVISQAQLEKKVADYLRNSQTMEDYWQRPVTVEELQAEMARMAKHTKQPEMLRELFEALGNDPSVIAECLARPALARHFATNFYRDSQQPSQSWTARDENRMPKLMAAASTNYTLPTISDSECEDNWTATDTTNAPSARFYHTAVWTGSEMIIWGGEDQNYMPFNSGSRYDPSTDNWSATSLANAPDPRVVHTAVWTGDKMIIWGGFDGNTYLNTGGRYDPITDSWTATTTANAPPGRDAHTAVWTGSEMIVWGGATLSATGSNTGGRYNPTTDSWTATTTSNAPDGRAYHTAVWTGTEIIVWGGYFHDAGGNHFFNTGGRYDPSTDSWTATNNATAPSERDEHIAVWTGSEMIVWGGGDRFNYFNTGGRYDPGTNSWAPTNFRFAPAGRRSHTAVWTGSEIIVWGGFGDSGLKMNTGGRYTPTIDRWTATTRSNAPGGRAYHTAVWTGSEMIVWGGQPGPNATNTGGRYCGPPAPTPTPSATPRVTPRPHLAPHLRPTPPP